MRSKVQVGEEWTLRKIPEVEIPVPLLNLVDVGFQKDLRRLDKALFLKDIKRNKIILTDFD